MPKNSATQIFPLSIFKLIFSKLDLIFVFFLGKEQHPQALLGFPKNWNAVGPSGLLWDKHWKIKETLIYFFPFLNSPTG